jgi:hypothetical protein
MTEANVRKTKVARFLLLIFWSVFIIDHFFMNFVFSCILRLFKRLKYLRIGTQNQTISKPEVR